MSNTNPLILGIPHRQPFLFIDQVTHLVPGVEAQGEKVFPSNDPMFQGHFPGNPIVPGVILAEALAQLAGIAGAGNERRTFLLSAIRTMKFPSAARPNEILNLRAWKRANLGALLQFEVCAAIQDRVVAEGYVILNEIKV